MVVSAQGDEALAVIERQAARLRAPLSIFGQDFLCRAERGRMVYEDQSGLLDLPLPRLPGRHQVVNAGTAIAALRQCLPNLPLAAYEEGIVKATWPGRLQNLGRGRLVGAGAEGRRALARRRPQRGRGPGLAEAMADFEDKAPRPLVLCYGALQTKDAAAFLRHFVGLATEVVALPVRGEQVGTRARRRRGDAARSLGLTAQAGSSAEDALREPRAAGVENAAAHSDRRVALSRRRRSRGERDAAGIRRLPAGAKIG